MLVRKNLWTKVPHCHVVYRSHLVDVTRWLSSSGLDEVIRRHMYTPTPQRLQSKPRIWESFIPNCYPTVPQELLLTRLAMGIVEREDDDVSMEKLDKALGDLFEKKVCTIELAKAGDCVFCFSVARISSLHEGNNVTIEHQTLAPGPCRLLDGLVYDDPHLCILPCPGTNTKSAHRTFSAIKALAQERLEGYRLHVEQAREEIEAVQVRTLQLHQHYSGIVTSKYRGDRAHVVVA